MRHDLPRFGALPIRSDARFEFRGDDHSDAQVQAHEQVALEHPLDNLKEEFDELELVVLRMSEDMFAYDRCEEVVLCVSMGGCGDRGEQL